MSQGLRKVCENLNMKQENKMCGTVASKTTRLIKSSDIILAPGGPSAAMRMPNSQHCLGPNVYPEVPDGGWGWAVAAAFFVVEVCTYGTLKSLGVFLEDLIDEYGESNSRVSWIISICVFIFTFTGQSLSSCLFFYKIVMWQKKKKSNSYSSICNQKLANWARVKNKYDRNFFPVSNF